MYPSKVPKVTAEIERNIRRGIYTDKLPSVTALQSQFSVAKQTITESVKLLSERKIVKSNAKRCGVQICRENLQPGKIMIIHRGESRALLAKLANEITLDGLTPYIVTFNKIPPASQFRQLDILGVIFTHSTLTVEWAEALMKAKIPFVSCNQLFSFPKVDTIDFDLEHDLKLDGTISCLKRISQNRSILFRFHRRVQRLFWEKIPSNCQQAPNFVKTKYTFLSALTLSKL